MQHVLQSIVLKQTRVSELVGWSENDGLIVETIESDESFY